MKFLLRKTKPLYDFALLEVFPNRNFTTLPIFRRNCINCITHLTYFNTIVSDNETYLELDQEERKRRRGRKEEKHRMISKRKRRKSDEDGKRRR